MDVLGVLALLALALLMPVVLASSVPLAATMLLMELPGPVVLSLAMLLAALVLLPVVPLG